MCEKRARLEPGRGVWNQSGRSRKDRMSLALERSQ